MRYLMVAAALAVGLAAHSAGAGMVYRWTDANGVVHFADGPPPHASQLRTQNMPDPLPADVPPPADAAGAIPAAGAATPGDGTAPSGPARVVVTDHHEEIAVPGTQSFSGKVKNEGGAEAHDVSVSVVVTEPTQGDECLHQDIDVQPATLAPGAEGTFEAEFDSPCFHGPTSSAVHPEWR